MTVPFSKFELAPVFPETLSVPAARHPASPRRQPLFARLGAWVEGRRNRARDIAELEAMSDRELADIGLSRSVIGRVFDADFRAEHAYRG
jgi:uncharacterized protein YjiS (DUF1127 family)